MGSRLSKAMRHSLLAPLLFAAGLALFAQDSKLYVVTHVDVTPNYTADAIKVLSSFTVDSRKDQGVVRFELLEEPRKNHFTIVSVWQNQAAFDAHVEARHTKEFREKIQPMLGSPFDERLHSMIQ
jgi:quinol monooxygenase YgiN